MGQREPLCIECHGHRGWFTDSGPVPGWEDCFECGGDGLAPDMDAEIGMAASNRDYNAHMNRVLNERAWKGEAA